MELLNFTEENKFVKFDIRFIEKRIDSVLLANHFRKIMLNGLKIYQIESVIVEKNDTNLPDRILVNRLMNIPLINENKEYKNLKFTIDILGKDEKFVLSKHIISEFKPVVDGIVITPLRSSHHVKINGSIKKEKTNHYYPALYLVYYPEGEIYHYSFENMGILTTSEILNETMKLFDETLEDFIKSPFKMRDETGDFID